MKQLVILALALFVGACSPHSDSTDARKEITAAQKSAALAFIEKGARLQTLTSQGVNPANFSSELATIIASWDVLRNTAWPDELSEERELLDQAVAGWKLTQHVWNAKIERLGADEFKDSTYNDLLLQIGRYYYTRDKDLYEALSSGIEKDELIPLSMSAASRIFEDAKQRVYARMKNEG